MLRDITIQNYRCFKDFHIDGLARVNLIVGMNNSGKTSLLEAIYLLVNKINPQSLVYLLHKRGEIIERLGLSMSGEPQRHQIEYQVRHLFYSHQPSLDQIISFHSTSYLKTSISLQNKQQQPSSFDNIPTIGVTPFELVCSFQSGQKYLLPVTSELSIEARWFQIVQFNHPANNTFLSDIDSPNNICLFLPPGNLSSQELAAMWNRITLTPKEDKVIDALRILEPDIERISFTSQPTFNSGILLRSRGQYPVPIGTMGDGIHRILNLAMAAVTVENGFLLVDEIETGLYHQTQTDMWRLILEVAQQLNIQVFATTHSWDCVCAFQEALDELEDKSIGKLFRLSQKGDTIRPVEYAADKLGVAVRQNIEVR